MSACLSLPISVAAVRSGRVVAGSDRVPDDLLAVLGAVEDRRAPRGARHNLVTVLAIEICAVLAGARAVICPAWRRTMTISSSRDISSSPGTGRSNRTPGDHSVIDPHMSPTAASAHRRQRVSPGQPRG
jgi:hypothetical protein